MSDNEENGDKPEDTHLDISFTSQNKTVNDNKSLFDGDMNPHRSGRARRLSYNVSPAKFEEDFI
jgi:hypothetical protein